MVYVGRQHGAPGSYLVPYELGRNVRIYSEFLAIHILTNCDIFHFGCYYAFFSIIHLRHLMSFFCPQWHTYMFEAQAVKTLVGQPFPPVFGC